MTSGEGSLDQDLSGGDTSSIIVTDGDNEKSISLDLQRYEQRKFLFCAVCIVCFLLYVTFFGVMWAMASHTIVLQMFIAHEHAVGLVLALLLVPSAMIWGLVRAIFKVESSKESYSDVLKQGMKECLKVHPSQ